MRLRPKQPLSLPWTCCRPPRKLPPRRLLTRTLKRRRNSPSLRSLIRSTSSTPRGSLFRTGKTWNRILLTSSASLETLSKASSSNLLWPRLEVTTSRIIYDCFFSRRRECLYWVRTAGISWSRIERYARPNLRRKLHQTLQHTPKNLWKLFQTTNDFKSELL